MPKYIVRWTELNHFEAETEADSPEEAQEICFTNMAEWMEHNFGGVEEDSIEIEEV